ncbi:ArsR/SmtB family transcription factor [Leadbettera azotonutricia]|uniref:Transcriptional regulator, ArsR family n=1 Tax=Leadbettera azotonutricia (strain ATCC BAA-888 / DSM 13862 / ZAS-9) TaxID=545695 RepID=F5YBD2_LEAAZ|nr:metalloregulator ArsR/SmtB family transcription factor [Leadbettera azotonutricia]AEF82872.1 transcriptional regulator, ArsR family [Leadbettera azotonutricia ZAS-9]
MLKNYERLFRALGDEHRLEIIGLLMDKRSTHPQDTMSAASLLKKFPFSQPTLSHHMKILCESSLVARHKIGKNIFYTLDISGLKHLEEFIVQLTRA